jgi:glutaredoxin
VIREFQMGMHKMARSRRKALWIVTLLFAASVAGHWWLHAQRAELGRAVAALAEPGDLHMYSSDTCGICVEARRWFQRHEVPFTECSIEREPDCRAEFDAMRAFATPVIVVRGQPTRGFDPERLREQLQGGPGRNGSDHATPSNNR